MQKTDLTLENKCLINQADDLKAQLVIANRHIRNLEEEVLVLRQTIKHKNNKAPF